MKVSVLIPTLNRLAYLKESLASARAQTHRDLEILVSDDGSTDGSPEYVRGVAAEDARVRLAERNPRPGLFENVNHLVALSAGEAFCILGDDDRLLPGFVEELARPLAEDESCVASFCDHWLIDGDGRRMDEATEHNSARYGRTRLAAGAVEDALARAMEGGMCMGFSLYRASVFRREPFDLACGGAADFDYAMRAAQLGVLHFVKQRLGEYRVHARTATATRAAFMIDGVIHAFAKHNFAEPRHERQRREILRARYRVKALYECTADRAEWRRSVASYLALGGQPLSPRIVLSCLLAAMPRRVAPHVKHAFKTLARAAEA